MKRTNEAGIALIKLFEGLKLRSYRDSVGVLTVGFGHTGTDVRAGETITEDEADRLLRIDLNEAEAAIDDAVSVELTGNQHGALVSFVFNLGAGALRRSTLLHRLNAGDTNRAADEFLKWDKAGKPPKRLAGLTRRRKAERALFLTDDEPDNKPILIGKAPAPEAPPVETTTEKVVTTTVVEKPGSTVVEKISSSVSTLAGSEQVKTIASEGVSKLATKAVGTLATAGTGATAGAATSSNPWPWIILAIVCVSLAVGVVIFLMKHKSNKETKAAEINSNKDRTDVAFAKK
jgi:lysozyme